MSTTGHVRERKQTQPAPTTAAQCPLPSGPGNAQRQDQLAGLLQGAQQATGVLGNVSTGADTAYTLLNLPSGPGTVGRPGAGALPQLAGIGDMLDGADILMSTMDAARTTQQSETPLKTASGQAFGLGSDLLCDAGMTALGAAAGSTLGPAGAVVGGAVGGTVLADACKSMFHDEAVSVGESYQEGVAHVGQHLFHGAPLTTPRAERLGSVP